jgi:5-(carboxyamino)imidazole ribonucleotide synthase
MEKLVTSELKLGVIAGGQLGKMLIQEASKWDIISYVLDNDENCPARSVASHYINGDHMDFDAVYNFGKQVDLVTFEIESVNTDALFKLKEEGVRVVPDPAILKLIQDKGSQKEFYEVNQIPTSPFKLYNNIEEIKKSIESGEIQLPFVQKLRKGGYDGRGVAVINNEKDISLLLDGPSVIEEKVSIAKEIAIIVARNENGEVKTFPAVEMVFDSAANLVEKLISPANISIVDEKEAQEIAKSIITKLNMRGLLAVELFIDDKGKILVNEVAPRPHNSGHHTIESIITSQYEQHLRAISNLPLGSTEVKLPSVMLNLLGEEGFEGNVKYEGLTESLAIEGVKIHLYGKKITKPYRKMGHITVLAKTQEEAINKADKVKHQIKVKAWNKHK